MGKDLVIHRHKQSSSEKRENRGGDNTKVPKGGGCCCSHSAPADLREYMRNHLFIKSRLDQERTLLKPPNTNKISIRNYTPKILGQEINMGMWM